MKHLNLSRARPLLGAGTMLVAFASSLTGATEPARNAVPSAGATLVGGALPGAGIVSAARSVTLVPVAGGASIAAPIATDGTFRVTGLGPGRYRLSLSSVTVPKQTQGATFGEKVNAGMASAGSAVASGTGAKHDTAKNSVSNMRGREAPPPASAPAPDSSTAASSAKIDTSGMPNRISMNVTLPRQNYVVDVDGASVDTDVGADGVLSGRVTAR